MKKIVRSYGLPLFALVFFIAPSAHANTVSPPNGTSSTTLTTVQASAYWELFDSTGTWVDYTGSNFYNGKNLYNICVDGTNNSFYTGTCPNSGVWHFVGSHANTTCTFNSYATCIASGDFDGSDITFTIGGPPPPPAPLIWGEDAFNRIFGMATSSASTTELGIVDYPNADVFMWIILFMLTAYGTINFFKK